MSQQDYEGFDLTMYNLFALLRQMYYTRGETETSFLQKSGGTITGSVTIQGNLVVNGQSYSIDTENLKVGDYTITLAKDNEQTLTSMVGMVVPKYDGTNYGFLGWDADGYAYVGDLTNYDGTSAITLANNSSLQRISTIDTTNTVVASNGVIYVYDATSHCFKKPTNDNKYYVIRNGAFVETELFTEQKSKNISNALYNVGSFDIVSGNKITRRTRYVVIKGDTFNWDSDNPYSNFYGIFYSNALPDIVAPADGYEIPKMSARGWNVYAREDIINHNQGITIQPSGNYFMVRDTSCSTKAELIAKLNANPIYIEYQSTTYNYVEDVIENTPNIALDQNGANWLQNEWKKGLNLVADTSLFQGYYRLDLNGEKVFGNSSFVANNEKIKVEPNTTYTLSLQSSIGAKINNVSYYDNNNNLLSSEDNANNSLIMTFTTPNNCYLLGFNIYSSGNITPSNISNIMLNEGTHAYPHSPYNQKEHITNDEATLLKQEEEKCRNLAQLYGEYYIDANTGKYVTASGNFSSYKTKVYAGHTYTFNGNCYSRYNLDGTYINQPYWNSSNSDVIFTPSSDCLVVITRISDNKLMLVEGTKAKPYQPYNGEIVHKADIEPVLLWENSSPTTAFASGSITTKDMSKYKYIVVEYSRDKNGTYTYTYSKNKYILNKGISLSYSLSYQGTTYISTREMAITSSTSISFGDGAINGGSNNDQLIPVAIYGTNVL